MTLRKCDTIFRIGYIFNVSPRAIQKYTKNANLSEERIYNINNWETENKLEIMRVMHKACCQRNKPNLLIREGQGVNCILYLCSRQGQNVPYFLYEAVSYIFGHCK
jgi:hypothetical protein